MPYSKYYKSYSFYPKLLLIKINSSSTNFDSLRNAILKYFKFSLFFPKSLLDIFNFMDYKSISYYKPNYN